VYSSETLQRRNVLMMDGGDVKVNE
jgi:hypothetical protein